MVEITHRLISEAQMVINQRTKSKETEGKLHLFGAEYATGEKTASSLLRDCGKLELGLIRKKSFKSSFKLKENKSNDQIFAYLVIIDFESTCWKEKNYKTQEIIEFPAVLLNVKSGQIESEFHFYVQPHEHPTLSAFCKELTGISQKQVEEGIPLNVCLKKFTYWLNKLTREKKIDFVGGDTSSSLRAAFVTWSDWDLSVCLNYECKRKQLLKPAALNRWIDLRATYRVYSPPGWDKVIRLKDNTRHYSSQKVYYLLLNLQHRCSVLVFFMKFYQRKPNGLNGALQDLGIEFEGREHSGLHDSRNTARLAWRMMRDGCIMKITKDLKPTNHSVNIISNPVITIPTPHQSPTKEITKKTQEAVDEVSESKIVTEASRSETETRKGSIDKMKEDKPEKFSKRKSLNDSDLSILDIDIEAIQCASLSPMRPRSTPKKSPLRKRQKMYSSPAMKKSPPKIKQLKFDPTKIFRDTSKDRGPSQHISKNPTNKQALKNIENHESKPNGIPHKTSSLDAKSFSHSSFVSPGPTSSIFKKPSPSLNMDKGSAKTPTHLCIPNSYKTPQNTSNQTLLSRSINNHPGDYKTPQNQSTRSYSHSSMKATTPLCKCGRRSKRRMVQTPGPNVGRFFFSCSKGKSSAGGCDFFSWDSASNLCSKSFCTSSIQTPKSNAFLQGSDLWKRQQTLSCPFKKVVKGASTNIVRGIRV